MDEENFSNINNFSRSTYSGMFNGIIWCFPSYGKKLLLLSATRVEDDWQKNEFELWYFQRLAGWHLSRLCIIWYHGFVTFTSPCISSLNLSAKDDYPIIGNLTARSIFRRTDWMPEMQIGKLFIVKSLTIWCCRWLNAQQYYGAIIFEHFHWNWWCTRRWFPHSNVIWK